MTTSKLLSKLFKRKSRKDETSDTATASASHTSSSVSTPAPTQHQLARTLQTRPQVASPFFSLPGELRNRIYAYATYPSLLSITIFQNPEPVLSANIFHLCRRIRSEAISHLCSSKSISLADLRTANKFFELVRDEMPSLRHITIRSDSAWRLGTAEVEVEKSVFLDYLELATGLKKLEMVVGQWPLSVQNRAQLCDAGSVGAGFLYAVRDLVDREVGGEELERVTMERLLALCKNFSAPRAVQDLKAALNEEYEQREVKVFRLYKVTSLEGGIERVELPMRMPGCLISTEHDILKSIS
ncbi:hypothetical protein C7974DRAFT_454945 [Boeremia exigua]|uniref:uncharacterized protein n=1 Tax=Boeremia exigua TaxID=749465 RepID=UPI001E8E150E|nr:uncharacterized protein C7974DRAFT_454945 [Boeremia exigua]KAH6629873.1 hypothetical protein C7974DRAFT_454945 [Boeremia exigua]